jgi:hypothetical protein
MKQKRTVLSTTSLQKHKLVNSSEYYLNHLYDMSENVKDILALVRNDLGRAGLTGCQIDKIADCNNQKCVEKQQSKLQDPRVRYIGAYALKNDSLVGFSRIGEWLGRDQLPYSSGFEYISTVFSLSLFEGKLTGEPLGIHELVVDDIDGDEQGRRKVIDMLLDKAIEIAESREVRLTHYDDSAVLASMSERGFEKTKKYHGTETGLRQLFVRPPYIPSLKELIESSDYNIGENY